MYFYRYLFQTYRIGQAERGRGANGWMRNSVIGWMLAATRAVEKHAIDVMIGAQTVSRWVCT